jgi:hypothetical protein
MSDRHKSGLISDPQYYFVELKEKHWWISLKLESNVVISLRDWILVEAIEILSKLMSNDLRYKDKSNHFEEMNKVRGSAWTVIQVLATTKEQDLWIFNQSSWEKTSIDCDRESK